MTDIERRTIAGWSIRWDADMAKHSRAEGWWLDRTIAESAAEFARNEPDRLLLIDGDRRLTAREIYAAATRLADALRRRGLVAGDVASFMLPNWHEACVVYLATTMLGVVAHPLVPNYRHAELSFMLPDCRSKIIFIPHIFRGFDYVSMLEEVGAAMETPPQIVVVRGEGGAFLDYVDLLEEGVADARFDPVDPDSVRMVLYTSGTTGSPKGVLHTHNSINADIVQLQKYWNGGGNARYLVASPVSHIGGSLYAFEMPLLYGTSAVLLDIWDPQVAAALIDAEGCTHTAGATPFLEQLLAAARQAGSRLESLRMFICGGASVPPSLIRDATDWFADCIVTRVYGSTEVPTITLGSISPGDIEHAAKTDGRIGIATVDVEPPLDGDGAGELLAKGPQMLAGYLSPKDEVGAFDDNGYFRMGDLGRLVDDDYIVITGRKKDLIIRHGENISPKEIEDILILHPAIAEVAVVGLPSARTGELACAFIVPGGDGNFDVQELGRFLTERGVAKFKFPERVETRAALPRNAAGKILKHVLKAEVLAKDKETLK